MPISAVVVDDEKDTLDVFSELLANHEINVVGKGYNGQEAISVVIDPPNLDGTDSRDAALFGLALGGLAVLFTAVYGIKNKVDTNSENISKNCESIKKKMFGALLGKDPIDVINNRLARGEITVEEYNQLKKALQRE